MFLSLTDSNRNAGCRWARKGSVVEPTVGYRATRNGDEPKFDPRPQREAIRANRYNEFSVVLCSPR